MASFENIVMISRPIDDVFAFLAELENVPKWNYAIVETRKVSVVYPRITKHVSLMFHTGALLPDPTGLLEGDGEISRVSRFRDEPDLAAAKTEALSGLIAAWIKLKS